MREMERILLISHNVRWTVVHVYTLIFRHRDDVRTVRAVPYAPHLIRVLGKRVQTLAFGNVPDFDRLVAGRGGEIFPISRERYRQHPGRVAGQRAHHVGVCHIVQLHVPIVRSGQQHL